MLKNDRPPLRQTESRLEQIKQRGNLRLQYIKDFYDRSPIFERYLAFKTRIHLHGLWYMHAGRRQHVEVLGACLSVKRASMDQHAFGSAQENICPMLVGVGQSLEFCQPVVSTVRLQLSDECYLWDRESFQVLSDPSPEILWTLTDRKLRSLLRQKWATGDNRSVDRLIENGTQFRRYSSNFRAYVLERIRHVVSEPTRLPWMRIEGSSINLEVFPALDRLLEIRQAFAGVL